MGTFLRHSVDGYEGELRIGSIDYSLKYAVQMAVFIATFPLPRFSVQKKIHFLK